MVRALITTSYYSLWQMHVIWIPSSASVTSIRPVEVPYTSKENREVSGYIIPHTTSQQGQSDIDNEDVNDWSSGEDGSESELMLEWKL